MDIILSNCSDPINKIEKSTTGDTTFSGTLKENTSTTDPVFVIESVTYPAFNYAYISEFNRYYYVKDIVNLYNNMWEVTLHVDVLKSFASAIMSSPCIIAKTASNDFNLYLNDPNFKCQQNDRFGMVNFPGGFDTDNAYFYLTFFG